MNKLKTLLLVIAVWLQVVLPLSLNAQEKSVGLVARASGKVMLTRNNQKSDLKKRADIFIGDQIITSDNAWVTINFYDLTRVVLRPNSKFTVHRFPQTMGDGIVQLELESGGARVVSGTNSSGSLERFYLMTPEGLIKSSRSEWVVRVCNNDDCEQLEESFSRCTDYVNPDLNNKQFVSVYKGSVQLEYCRSDPMLTAGTTASSKITNNMCETVEYIPCVILSDGNLGKDKLKAFLPDLIKLPSSQRRNIERPVRPLPRPRPPRPRTNRPRSRP